MTLQLQRKAYIVGGMGLVASMFRACGYEVQQFSYHNVPVKDGIVVWTGGSDINPALYGEKPHKSTHFAPMRDEYEVACYYSLDKEVPKVGICRGGQLLNVLSGGKLWQDVDGHHGNHFAFDTRTNEPFEVTSIHHQMMRPSSDAVLLADAHKSKYVCDELARYSHASSDPEALYYDTTKSFCFQPHPEFGMASCQKWFMKTIEELYALPAAKAQAGKDVL
jgi:GMP synthase-like glutamine amidotransferase